MYKNDKIINKKYLTHQFKQFPINQKDIYIVSKRGMRLDILADKYYNDTLKWWVIASANKLPCDSLIIQNVGIELRIPYLER